MPIVRAPQHVGSFSQDPFEIVGRFDVIDGDGLGAFVPPFDADQPCSQVRLEVFGRHGNGLSGERSVECVGDLYVFDFSGGEEERARREAERAAERAQVRDRYAHRVMDLAGVDEITADLVMAALFDHFDADGDECRWGNHPKLPDGGEYSHDAGFDCKCTWDEARRERERQERKRFWDEWQNSPEAKERQAEYEAELTEISEWVDAHPGVEAERKSTYCPEQWEGTVDGHSFYFRERHGAWRIEIDLEPDGHFVQRVVGTGPDGELITEPVEMKSGPVIAEGLESVLGETAIHHLEFIVRTIREHLTGIRCAHDGAGSFCPTCGARV